MTAIDPKLNSMSVEFVSQINELFDLHKEDIQELLNETVPKKIKVGFSIVLDLDSVPASVETTMSFSKVVKDRRTSEIHGDDEPALPGLDGTRVTVSFGSTDEPPPNPDGEAQMTAGVPTDEPAPAKKKEPVQETMPEEPLCESNASF